MAHVGGMLGTGWKLPSTWNPIFSYNALLRVLLTSMQRTVTRMQQVNLPVRVLASWWPDCTHQVFDTCCGSYDIHFDCAQNNNRDGI
jgi:hypothetical protein